MRAPFLSSSCPKVVGEFFHRKPIGRLLRGPHRFSMVEAADRAIEMLDVLGVIARWGIASKADEARLFDVVDDGAGRFIGHGFFFGMPLGNMLRITSTISIAPGGMSSRSRSEVRRIERSSLKRRIAV